MKFNIVNLSFKTNQHVTANASKVRGFLGNQFSEYIILHNHYGGENFLYSYPLVQYNVFDDTIHVLGIDEGAKILKHIAPEINSFSLDKEYIVEEKTIHEKEVDIKPSSEEKHYKFITPWLGLNNKNYPKYRGLKTWKEKKELINKILVGNILSMSKGLGIIVNKKLYAKTHFKEQIVDFKSLKMNAFTGEFKIHYDIPDYFGLGKGVSHGFGCVKQIIYE
ncbi:CRISPR-associated endonuclease Cas6 [uncultured Methanobrevibacter sp.]|uniref:CRISPR-associated endonuclease Cas6 n=1 Tax=uncultured Methanobrevibacter sp. TaxID=253161 RepID=UPI0025F1901D|nr:CRISPR-associated endonuclease Cas6 [uncultured Methanobrevibacter sp.]